MKLAASLIKHKNKIVNIACILLALMVANKIYKTQVKAWESLSEQNSSEISKNKLLASIREQEAGIDSYKKLLTPKDISSVINTIANFAGGTGVKIVSIKPGAEEKRPQYTKVPLTLKLSTPSYHALGKFISKIESLPDVYIIETLTMGQEAEEIAVNLKVSSIVMMNQ